MPHAFFHVGSSLSRKLEAASCDPCVFFFGRCFDWASMIETVPCPLIWGTLIMPVWDSPIHIKCVIVLQDLFALWLSCQAQVLQLDLWLVGGVRVRCDTHHPLRARVSDRSNTQIMRLPSPLRWSWWWGANTGACESKKCMCVSVRECECRFAPGTSFVMSLWGISCLRVPASRWNLHMKSSAMDRPLELLVLVSSLKFLEFSEVRQTVLEFLKYNNFLSLLEIDMFPGMPKVRESESRDPDAHVGALCFSCSDFSNLKDKKHGQRKRAKSERGFSYVFCIKTPIWKRCWRPAGKYSRAWGSSSRNGNADNHKCLGFKMFRELKRRSSTAKSIRNDIPTILAM